KYRLLVRVARKFQRTQPNTSLSNNTGIPSTRVSPHSITKKTTRTEAKTSRLHGKCNYVTSNYKLAKELEVSNALIHMDASTSASKHSPASSAAYDDEIDGKIDEILEYDSLVKHTQCYSSLCNYQPCSKKTHTFLNKRTDSFFVLITIERAFTGVLADTGCNISTISPNLANFLKIKIPHM
ncbi:hypothetical protein CU097_004980, partial [Rhizopus azygosporus]